MTLQEANSLLDAATLSDKPWRPNPSMTLTQAAEIVRSAINSSPRALASDGVNLDPILEKRVYQVVRNQKNPRY